MLDWLNVDYVRHLVEIEKKTLPEISEALNRQFPNKAGLSVSNLKQFCTSHHIRKHVPLSANEVVQHVAQAVNEVGGTYGRKMMKGHQEHSHGVTISERRIRESLRTVHPFYHYNRQQGTQNQVNPSSYHAPYFGYNLHLDQNEKLEMFGVVYVAAIDAKSAFVTACAVMPRKNNIAIYRDILRKTVDTFGLFEQVIVDHGREFYLALFMQHYYSPFRQCNRAPYKQVPSTKNNRIERWWCELNKRVSYPIKYCLIDFEREDRDFFIDRSIPHHQFSVSTVVVVVARHGAEVTVNAWNSHVIPGSGKPKSYLIGSQATKLQSGQLLDEDQALQMYETSGGVLTRESQYGEDLLGQFPGTACSRNDEYWNVVLPRIGTVGQIFGSVANHNYTPLQDAIREHIRLSEFYRQNITL